MGGRRSVSGFVRERSDSRNKWQNVPQDGHFGFRGKRSGFLSRIEFKEGDLV